MEIASTLNKETLSSQDLTVLCPLLLYQLESGKCHETKESSSTVDSRSSESNKKPSSTEGKEF